MEQNNNPLIEQFRKEFLTQGNIASRESWNSIPMIAFRVAATAGWANICAQINSEERVSYRDAGNQLCLFAIEIMANDIDGSYRISEVTLDLGVECLKSLVEIHIDSNADISVEKKETDKQIGKEFLNFWKDCMKEALKQEGRLL